jgi:tetratricopeptide (TPR) repeat protein
VLFFLISLQGFCQDSIPMVFDLTEEMELDFQHFFFKALSEKAIGNHQNALENLESCNQIRPNNVAIFFEFSKNYLALDNILLAKEYIERALQKDATNSWMQTHLANILRVEKQHSGAVNNPQKGSVADKKYRLEVVGNKNTNKIEATADVFKAFETTRSYAALTKVLERVQENTAELLKYGAEGVLLFPAQPFVYLMYGKALNLKKEHKKATTTLKDGLDFVYEASDERAFYAELAISYQGLGDDIAAEKYRQKSKKIKN